MATLSFTPNLLRHVDALPARIEADTVGGVLDGYFRSCPGVRGYILDDQGEVRRHVAIFVNGELIRDRAGLSDAVCAVDEIFVAQALSGG